MSGNLQRMELIGREILLRTSGTKSGRLTGRAIVFAAQRADAPQLLFGRGRGNSLREDTYHVGILQRVPRSAIAADDVVVQHALNVPAHSLGHFGKMRASEQALLLTGHGKKDDRRGKTMLAEHAGTLEADGGAAGVV